MIKNQNKLALAGSSLIVALLTACGGSDNNSQPTSPSTTITGTAATGAAIVGGAVTAKCASGTAAGITGTDGSFTLSLASGQTAPCILQVTKGAVTLYGYASTAGHVNITPLTDMTLSKALADSPAVAFNNFDTAHQNSIAAGLISAKAYVKAQIIAAGLGTPTGDLLTDAFVVGDANDHIFDALSAALNNASKSMTDLRVLAAGGATLTTLISTGSTTTAGTGLTVSAASNSTRNGSYTIAGATFEGSGAEAGSTGFNGNTTSGNVEMEVLWGADNTVKRAAVWYNSGAPDYKITFFGCDNSVSAITCTGKGVTYDPILHHVTFTNVNFPELVNIFPAALKANGETATFNGTIATK